MYESRRSLRRALFDDDDDDDEANCCWPPLLLLDGRRYDDLSDYISFGKCVEPLCLAVLCEVRQVNHRRRIDD